jgi:hypothetical protein
MEVSNMRRWFGVTLAVALLAACGTPDATGPVKSNFEDISRDYVSVHGYGRALEPRSAESSSARTSGSGYTTYGVNRAIDGDTNTEWANQGWQDRDAWLILNYDRPMNFDTVEIKTGPMKRSHYVLETSMDGNTWRRASGVLRNRTWDMEVKKVNGRGRFLRVHWYNDDDPRGYFAIFEVQAYGRPSGSYALADPIAIRR